MMHMFATYESSPAHCYV